MASALVQMTAFSPCSQLGDMIMIGMEGSLESFPGLREEGNKRSHSDGDEEQDRSHVKKRRKQSKPNRITATDSATETKETGHNISELDFSETGEHFLSERLVPVNTNSVPVKQEYDDIGQNMTLEPNKSSSDNQDKTAQNENIFNSLLPLNLSNIKSSFTDTHVSETRQTNTPNKQASVDNNNQSQFPQPQDSSKPPVAQESSYLSQSSSLLLPLFKQSHIQTQISQMTSQMRIFNPEAFCDLCNKEFCNKYFLKTHKANKHGIYTENTSGPTLLDPMPSMPFTYYFSNNNETYENPQTFQATNVSKNLFNQTSYPVIRTPQKKIQTPQQPQQNSLFSLKSNSSSSGNMRALCNICQREFCNKYFVRRHKLKIHGIVDPGTKDSPALDSSIQENHNLSNTSQEKLDLLASDGEIYSGYSKQYMPSNFNIDFKDVSQSLEINMETTKEKSDKETENNSQTVLLPHISTPTENNSLSLFKISQNEENSKDNSISSNKPKKLGVVNADAFCDICCKEYCNKYFLRTHKLKSHGIFPVEEKKDDAVNGATGSMSWFHDQTSPLNLIVNDISANRDSTDKSCFDEGDECMCSTCGRFFQSQFLLKMHQAYTHPEKLISNEILPLTKKNTKPLDVPKVTIDLNEHEKPHQPIENYTATVKSDYSLEPEESVQKVLSNTENIQKLQTLISRLNNANASESSVCDVCEKDVGHISLLENHLLKEHAVLLEELGSIVEEENSSSQSSLVLSTYAYKKECPHCQKVFFKASQFEQHLNEFHGDINVSTDHETAKGIEVNSSFKISSTQYSVSASEDRQGLHTPASSFCEICKKELCNKYFMKTHMQRMHGISIENGAQIGGVVCDICNKELCSKYFLRVHKQNSHGIVDELFLPQLGLDYGRNQSPNTDPALKPSDQNDLNHRYFTHYSEVCTLCHRRFRSVKWLKSHLWNDHGEDGKEVWRDMFFPPNSESRPNLFEETLKDIGKPMEFPTVFGSSNQSNFSNNNESNQNGKELPDKQGLSDNNVHNNTMFSMLMNGKDSENQQYQCSYCSFSTTILAFFFIHERSHKNKRSLHSDIDQSFQCPICFKYLDSKDQLNKHLKLHKMQLTQFTWNANLSNSNQELPKVSGIMPEIKNDFGASTTKDKESDEKEAVGNVAVTSEHTGPANQPEDVLDTSVLCTRCGFRANNVQVYLDHVSREHPFPQMEPELPAYLQRVEQALATLAGNSGIPAVFAAPRTNPHQHQQATVTMQPFLLEDSENASGMNNEIDPKPGKTFLSSLVFLPVKEKLKKSVTASFKLTPT